VSGVNVERLASLTVESLLKLKGSVTNLISVLRGSDLFEMADQAGPEEPREILGPLHPDFTMDKGKDHFRRRIQVIGSKLDGAIKNLTETVITYDNLRYEADRMKARVLRTEGKGPLKEFRLYMEDAPQDLVEGCNHLIAKGERELGQIGAKLDNKAMPGFVVSAGETVGVNNPARTEYWEADLGDGGEVGGGVDGEEDGQSIDIAVNDLSQAEVQFHQESQPPFASRSQRKLVRSTASGASNVQTKNVIYS
jgi:hypothetical protein